METNNIYESINPLNGSKKINIRTNEINSMPLFGINRDVENHDIYSKCAVQACNTYDQTGLTPSQLLEQRDELRDALNELLDMIGTEGTHFLPTKKYTYKEWLQTIVNCSTLIQKTNPAVKQQS